MYSAIRDVLTKLEDEGFNVDNANIQELKSAIEDEYDCGADGSVYDVVLDLNDSIGLKEFGITG